MMTVQVVFVTIYVKLEAQNITSYLITGIHMEYAVSQSTISIHKCNFAAPPPPQIC